MDNIKFFIRKNKICWHIGVSRERVVSIKVYEVMEQYKSAIIKIRGQKCPLILYYDNVSFNKMNGLPLLDIEVIVDGILIVSVWVSL